MKQADIDRDILIDELEDKLHTLTNEDEKIKLKAEIDDLYEVPSWFKRWDTCYGKNLDLKSCLKGIYISQSSLEIFGADHPAFKRVMEDPLYKGIFVSPNEKAKQKEEQKKTKILKP
jgi:hypothetical protein